MQRHANSPAGSWGRRWLKAAVFVASALACLPGPSWGAVLVEFGSSTRYLDNTTDPGIGMTWTADTFDDTGWTPGVFGVGYDNGAAASNLLQTTVPDTTISLYTRTTFNVVDASQITNLYFGADYDDGYVAWINGVEVFRSAQMPPGPLLWNTPAGDHESSNAASPEYDLRDIGLVGIPALQNGVNVLAVGVWNTGGGSSDLVLVPQLLANETPAVTRGPYLQQGTDDGVTVRWRTNVPVDSRVAHGSQPGSLTTVVDDPALVTEHEVQLSGLPAATEFFYSIGSTVETLAGDDPDHAFKTSPLPGVAAPTRIWIIGDSGTGNSNAEAVRDAYATLAGGARTDLWLMLGDNAYPNGTQTEYQAKVFDFYPEMLRQTVLWPTLGNHDGYSANSSTESGPYYDIFTLPRAGEAGGAASGTEAYYSFDYGNIHFVVLDSFESDRSIGSDMLLWLAMDLGSTTRDWIIAYWHHPPYSKGSHDSDSETELVEMRTNVVPLLEDNGVDLVFTGHSHSYERSFLIDGHAGDAASFDPSMKIDGGDGRVDGDSAYEKPMLGPDPHQGTVYTVAGSAGQISGGDLDHPAMYLSLNVLGSVILDVDGNRLDARFLDKDGVIRDYFTIFKGATQPPPVAAFSESPVSGLAPLTVDFTDQSSFYPNMWSWDFEDDGLPDSSLQHPSHQYIQPGLYSVELSISNAVGADMALHVDAVCVHLGVLDEVVGLAGRPDKQTLTWSALPAATKYDIVKGDLNQLRASGGDFGVSQLACIEDDGLDTEALDMAEPSPGQGFFYITRATNCASQTGTFDTTGPGQVASRDPGLQGAGALCACDVLDDFDVDGLCNAFDSCTDGDGDGFGNPGFPANTCMPDNCPAVGNVTQADVDTDGLGDVCDICPADTDNDSDGDTICVGPSAGPGATGTNDNCPVAANTNQVDVDTDGQGDVCDICPADTDNDSDTDTICVGASAGPGATGTNDNCPIVANTNQVDADTDGQGDLCDTCPIDPLNDIDTDGICGDVDICPFDPLNDEDLDTICGDVDNCPSVANMTQDDFDTDSIGDLCDPCTDTDTDGYGNPGFGNICTDDNCPLISNPGQADTDLDGAGDPCDCAATVPGATGPPDPLGPTLRADRIQLSWLPTFQGRAFNVYQGSSTGAAGTGPIVCVAAETTNQHWKNSPNPASGSVFYYLVAARNVCDESLAGTPTNGPPVVPGSPCPVLGVDRDSDGLVDTGDNCPIQSNPLQPDADGDFVGDDCDNCIATFNPDQADSDGDNQGDACDP